MGKPAVLLAHGMGSFTAPGTDDQGNPIRGGFAEEFLAASTTALQRYEKHRSETMEKYVDIHEFNYDSWFDDMRKETAERSKSMKERISAVAGIYGVTFPMTICRIWI